MSDETGGGYVMVPTWVVQRLRDRPPAPKRVPTKTALHAYTCLGLRGTFRQGSGEYVDITISYATLATDMECDRSTAIRACGALEDVAALTIRRRVDAAGDPTSNDFRVIFGQIQPPEDKGVVAATPPPRVSHATAGGGSSATTVVAATPPNPEPTTHNSFDPDGAPRGVNAAPAPDDGQRTAKDIVTTWTGGQRHPPPRALIGQIAKQVGDMVRDGVHPDHIRMGLHTFDGKGVHPSVLPSLVYAAQQLATADIRGFFAAFAGCGQCTAGWPGEDDRGRAVPCSTCKPHARPVVEHAPEYVEVTSR